MRPILSDLAVMARAPAMSRDELVRLQGVKLRRIFRHAYENVPFYRERYQAAGLTLEDIQTAEDVRRLPIVTREELQAADVDDRLAKGFRRESCRARYTSGSSGQPLEIRSSRWDEVLRNLLEVRTMRSVGVRAADRIVTLGPSRSRSPRWYHRRGFFSTQLISGALPMRDQLELLRASRPDVLWIYPAVASAFGDEGIRLSDFVSPRILITSGEPVEAPLREALRADLGSEPYNFYGCHEVGRVAAECPARQGLHLMEDHVLVEIVPDPDLSTDNNVGVVLLTNLDSRAMPFLRYRVGDLASWAEGPCACGRASRRIARLVGRTTELIQLSDGRRKSLDPIMFVLRRVEGLRQYQVIQEALDQIRVLVALEGAPGPDVAESIREDLAETLPANVIIQVDLVDSIPKTRPKTFAFVSRLDQRTR